MRTLIVDLARAVGSGAHMIALERTHNGPFHVCVDGAPPLSEARKVRPVTLAEFADVPRLYEAMGEAEQVLKLSKSLSKSSRQCKLSYSLTCLRRCSRLSRRSATMATTTAHPRGTMEEST